jgi:hypothetical protein
MALMVVETKGLTLPCIQCGVELEESAMLEFGGSVACEKCVRAYYAPHEKEFPGTGNVEVQTRRRNAVAWVKRNRRQLEKQAEKRAR